MKSRQQNKTLPTQQAASKSNETQVEENKASKTGVNSVCRVSKVIGQPIGKRKKLVSKQKPTQIKNKC